LAQLDEMLDQDAAIPLRADLQQHLENCEHCN
jgi:hypothetical protein